MSKWTAAHIPDQTGRTFVVTGANSGLGLETARRLAEHGAHVIMTARDPEKGRAAAASLPGSVEVRTLDLAELESVSRFAAGVDHADVLVNNAGVMMTPKRTTAQGFELQLGTNHLGHFALTALLYPVLRAGSAPRIVTVSSTLHRRGRIDFDDLQAARSYSPFVAYSQSKFANVLFGLELDRRLRAAGSPAISVLAHPGYTATNLQTSGPTGLLNLSGRIGNLLMAQHVTKGALDQLCAATAPAVQGGEFYGPDGRGENRGHPKLVKPVASATDPDTARRLWEVSEKLTGLSFAP
ncbi:oxidoreductase [Streptomyces poriferorum]|uniref:Oxidoreductase n=1 Tax=Streptomyces poriferorum TaxID=2798799 RepID=A0ABY9IID3_9ACTN|nr:MULTISPECIES: oxidoreductase [unclassified Streptomyces]MDP5315708.1 oxidoreductase [Streptomyces sp. Alt4]WLQ53160.1 oxidoreductase [Streptomyces sp. Alt1]WLQ54072.1 oxidoreductase [Streptomyces sp. Alt2]